MGVFEEAAEAVGLDHLLHRHNPAATAAANQENTDERR